MIAPFWYDYLHNLEKCRRCCHTAAIELQRAVKHAHEARVRLEANVVLYQEIKGKGVDNERLEVHLDFR